MEKRSGALAFLFLSDTEQLEIDSGYDRARHPYPPARQRVVFYPASNFNPQAIHMALEPPTEPCRARGTDYSLAYFKKLSDNINPAAIAGALGFPTTQGIWDLYLHDPLTKPIFDDWGAERKTDGRFFFHHSRLPKMVNLANNSLVHRILCSETHSDHSKGEKRRLRALGATILKQERPTILTLWYIVRLARTKSALFSRSWVTMVGDGDGDGGKRAYLNLNPCLGLSLNKYDVLHAWKLLNWEPVILAAVNPVYHYDETDSGRGDSGFVDGGGIDGDSVVAEQQSQDAEEAEADVDVDSPKLTFVGTVNVSYSKERYPASDLENTNIR
ncbi:uncharacterized protein BDV17DRAFT_294773 [Aspergillus undulatus]|uniref:uncharacterized protein n=1 Tax=Aspergillus undulatus TaxID=1810928 RepID=UPI003CCD8221